MSDARDTQAGAGWHRLPALGRIRTWRNRRRLSATLGSLEDYQLEDIGIRRGSVRDYVRAGPDAHRLLRRMLALCGIEPDGGLAGSRDWDALLAGCRTCPATAACGRWIRGRSPGDGDRAFCPNRAAISALMRRQGGGRRPEPGEGVGARLLCRRRPMT